MDHGDNLIELIFEFSPCTLEWDSNGKGLGFSKIILGVKKGNRNKEKTLQQEVLVNLAEGGLIFNLPRNRVNQQSRRLYFFLDRLDRL